MPDGVNRPPNPKRDYTITPTRILLWIVVGGIGIVLVITGIVGIVTKG
jgi:hypothetical protein